MPNDFELRCYVVRGQVEHVIFSSFGGFDEDGCAFNFLQKTRRQAVYEWLHGDEACMTQAEAKASKLVSRWLGWLACLSAGHAPPPAVRAELIDGCTSSLVH